MPHHVIEALLDNFNFHPQVFSNATERLTDLDSRRFAFLRLGNAIQLGLDRDNGGRDLLPGELDFGQVRPDLLQGRSLSRYLLRLGPFGQCLCSL